MSAGEVRREGGESDLERCAVRETSYFGKGEVCVCGGASLGEGAGFKMQAVAGWADHEEKGGGERQREREEKCPARGGDGWTGKWCKGWVALGGVLQVDTGLGKAAAAADWETRGWTKDGSRSRYVGYAECGRRGKEAAGLGKKSRSASVLCAKRVFQSLIPRVWLEQFGSGGWIRARADGFVAGLFWKGGVYVCTRAKGFEVWTFCKKRSSPC